MNIVFSKCIFAYLCIFYSSTKNFHEFQSIFVNFRFTDIFVKISTNISDISVKSKYRYIRNYRYFVPWYLLGSLNNPPLASCRLGAIGVLCGFAPSFLVSNNRSI